jgi:GH35 family endo-1,4-beta-xylanase
MKYLGASVSSIGSVEQWSSFRSMFNAAVIMTFWRQFDGGSGGYRDQPVREVNDWIVRCRDSGMYVAGHPVVYNLAAAQGPDYDAAQMMRHVEWYAGTFSGLSVVDVVNEHHHYPVSGFDQMIARWRSLRPDCRVRLNEYGLSMNQIAFSRIVRDAYRPWLHLADVIGIQCHWLDPLVGGKLPSITTVQRNLDALVVLGKPIHVTEISIPSNRDGWTESKQAEWLDRLLNLFHRTPAVEGCWYWDLSDANAWNRTSGLWRADGTPKPAWNVLASWRTANLRVNV